MAVKGRIYSRYSTAIKLLRFFGILLLALIVLFFFLYFEWKKYIVYTDDGLYLDLPMMHRHNAASHGASPSTGGTSSVKSSFSDDAEPGDPGDVPSEGTPSDEAPDVGDNEAPDEAPNTDDGSTPDTGDGSTPDTLEPSTLPQPEDDDGTDENGVRNSF